jgi:hypothetical protein
LSLAGWFNQQKGINMNDLHNTIKRATQIVNERGYEVVGQWVLQEDGELNGGGYKGDIALSLLGNDPGSESWEELLEDILRG